jgi:hypothetical protein
MLADSGSDPLGDAIEMLERMYSMRGPTDVLLSCCLEFPEALNPGLPDYLLTLPFGRLRQIYEERKRGVSKSITLGINGVVEACRASRARYFLPYAHGFSGIGCDPIDGEGQQKSEQALMLALRQQLEAEGVSTEVLAWRPGDAASFDSSHRLRLFQ